MTQDRQVHDSDAPVDVVGALRRHLVAMAQTFVALAAALALMWSAAVTVFALPVERFLQEFVAEALKPMQADLSQIQQAGLANSATLRDLGATVSKINVKLSAPPPLLEFNGGQPVRLNPGRVLYPGDTVSFLYSLRRRVSCETDVYVQFYSEERGRVASEYSFLVSSVKAPVTSAFIAFPADVRLPLNIEPGRYSYMPLMIPRGCDEYGTEIAVPPSPVFEVVRRPE